jgi:hypothetical protein
MNRREMKKGIASASKRVTKGERMMTDKESSDVLESASQAVAMLQGSTLLVNG